MLYVRDFALSKGIPSKILMKNTNAERSLLLNPPKLVNEQVFHRMGFNLFTALENTYAGVIEFGQGMALSLHGSLGLAIQGSSNLNEVAKLAQKYYQIRANNHSLYVVTSENHCALRLSRERLDYDYHYFIMATLVSFQYAIATLLNHHCLDSHCIIHLQTPEPDNFPWKMVKDYQIKFDQADDQILVPMPWMILPIKPIDPELAKLAKKQCEQTMKELSPQDIVIEVRNYLRSALDHNLGLKKMAEQLHLSPSTLQRRLREFNTTYKAIKMEERLNKAKQLLLKKSHTLESIAEQLGFSDASSFTKSFKSFTRCTPSTYRKNHTS